MLIQYNFNMIQNCSFCFQPSIIFCMNRSLHNKHSEEDDRSYKIISDMIQNEESANYLKFKEVVVDSDTRQFMNYYMKGKILTKQYQELLEYYKYRLFVPIFAKSPASERAMSYYYDKLKHYYNKIKRKLNITVENSSISQLNTYTSRSNTDGSTKEEVLKDLKREMQEENKKKKISSIISYKTESKALEELVSYLKLNPQFDNIKTLRTQDCFEEQKMFEETTQKKIALEADHYDSSMKANLKTKLFKRIVEGTTQKREIPVLNHQNSRERPKSRAKSIKIIKFADNKEPKKDEKVQKMNLFKPSQPRVKASISTKTLPGRNSSLERINQNHYASPYKKKALSTDKNKATTAILSKPTHRNSTQNMKIKNFEAAKKSRDSILTTQLFKFQNTPPYKSTPISPSGRKTPRPEIKVTKTDNILTIRKKKLEALKEKISRK